MKVADAIFTQSPSQLLPRVLTPQLRSNTAQPNHLAHGTRALRRITKEAYEPRVLMRAIDRNFARCIVFFLSLLTAYDKIIRYTTKLKYCFSMLPEDRKKWFKRWHYFLASATTAAVATALNNNG